jgi:hypothetical protein
MNPSLPIMFENPNKLYVHGQLRFCCELGNTRLMDERLSDKIYTQNTYATCGDICSMGTTNKDICRVIISGFNYFKRTHYYNKWKVWWALSAFLRELIKTVCKVNFSLLGICI